VNGWREAMEDLSSAEEFLDFFGVEHDPAVVRVHRLHILQRFHDYLAADGASFDACAEALRRAYGDFVRSDARTERVFKVFRREATVSFVPITAISRRNP
jgi:nitrogenase-stabilizing/protective protein